MTASKDPIAAAANTYLWPYLRELGFSKVTTRKYARERNCVIQQLWIDANGIGGKRRTVIVLCCNFVFGSITGYMDPHGFRICNAKSWNMGTCESAEYAMQLVVRALAESELARLEQFSSTDSMIAALRDSPRQEWFLTCAALMQKWNEGDKELQKVADRNRAALKLISPNKSLNGDVAKATRR